MYRHDSDIAQQRIRYPLFSLFIPFFHKYLRESNGEMGQSWDKYLTFLKDYREKVNIWKVS